MPMKLSLISIERDGYVRVATDGPMSAGDFIPERKNPFELLLGDNWATHRVLLNLDLTTFIDSSAIGWLIGCQRDFKKAGGSLVVHSVRPAVRQILDLLKIGRIVPLADNEPRGKAVLLGGAV
jgi:anti-anti-sigma factor